jgi:hypothetical protein
MFSARCHTVSQLPSRERRRHERYPQALDVHARCLLSGLGADDPAKEFDGRVQNLSGGGACILCSSSVQPSQIVRCSFPVSDTPVSIPTLMQVRWTVKRGQKSPNYLSGFQFVF